MNQVPMDLTSLESEGTASDARGKEMGPPCPVQFSSVLNQVVLSTFHD